MSETAARRAGTFTIRQSGKGNLKLLIVTAARTSSWILPMGKIEPGEDADDAAARETAEEAGVEVEIGPYLAELTLDRRGTPGPVDFFLARYVGDRPWEESHKRDRAWIPLERAHEWLPEVFRSVAEAALEHLG